MKINLKKISPASVFPFILIAVILIAVAVVWKINPIDYSMYDSSGITYNKGKVVSVNSETLEESSDTPGRNIGVQNITVKLLEGKNKGKTVTFDNRMSYTHSIEVDVGTRVVVKCDEPEGVTPYYSLYQYDRSIGIIAAILIFLIIICLVGRGKGLRAAIALGVSVLIVVGALIPAIYNGYSPILITLFVCMSITAVTLFLLNGFSKKTWAAVISTMIGLLVSALLYTVISGILTVTGYAMDETEDLVLISRHTGLVIGEILFSGILLSSLGAVMDTAMSIASALFEIADTKPDIKKAELYRSGMNIGRDMISTMCQTLVLAFTGSSVATLLVVISYGTSLNRFLSSDFLATEILQALIGSFAVIMTVPITALLCSRLHAIRNQNK
ncbi:MAG: YibE/F family protein [Clostridia bacterium]|nr:YibE/F family protein [Clostridia bacterium]